MLKRLIFWDFPRTTWQYDVVVGLILAFIFLTPRWVFNDQPRVPGIVRLPARNGAGVFFVETALLKTASPETLTAEAAALIGKRTGRRTGVARVQPVEGEGGEVNGYMVYLQP